MDDKEDIIRHSAELYKCRQRGGELFSLVDLMRVKTIPSGLAAFLLCRVSAGDSFITGAVPGSAGKTTIMCALVNAIPNGMKIRHAESAGAMLPGESKKPSCYICHEIGSGNYFAYLWGEELRQFSRLKEYGHLLASNLHADTLEQARNQIVKQNGVKESEFNSVNIYMFIKYDVLRTISSVWCSKNGLPHKKVYDGEKLETAGFADPKDLKLYEDFLLDMDEQDIHTIEDFRKELTGFRE